MRFLFAALCLLGLAACGVDGAPIKPTGGLGLGISPRGVSVNPRAGVQVGPVKLGLSL